MRSMIAKSLRATGALASTACLVVMLSSCESINISALGDAIGAIASGDGQDTPTATTPPPGTPATSPPARDASTLANDPDLTPYLFTEAGTGAPPEGFTAQTSRGATGTWQVARSDKALTPPNALVHRGAGDREGISALLRDKEVPEGRTTIRTQLLIENKGTAKTAGLMVNAEKASDGYGIFFNVPDNRITVERVVEGYGQALTNSFMRGSFGALRQPLETDRWYDVMVVTDTSRPTRTEVEVFVDGFKVYAMSDNRFLASGRFGPVAKGDTVAWFDNITISESRPHLRPVEVADEPEPECVQEFRYGFEQLPEGAFPPEFTSVAGGSGSPGKWVGAPGDSRNQKTVRQVSVEENQGRFNILAINDLSFVNGYVRADVKTEQGQRRFQEAGLVFRYQNPQNYYMVTINSDEDTVSLVRVANGIRQNISTVNRDISSNRWYRITVHLDGINIRVRLQERDVITAADNTFLRGSAGLTTRSSTVADFDNLKVCIRDN
ncbi:MAG: hypothetical protein JJU11_15300 [Candidatus Sumerlaeia bacterium]|nr:hypothetical protein [Candidatus Sumerlaeia bacterium]